MTSLVPNQPVIRSRPRILRLLACRLLLLLACGHSMCTTIVAATVDPDPGALKELQFTGPDKKTCTIKFRWCPSAKMKDGDPDKPGGKPNAMVEGFWLSETEVSQEEYRIIAGEEAMAKAKAHVLDKVSPVPVNSKENFTPNDRRQIEERGVADKEYFADSGMPVLGLPAADADAFCVKLSQVQRARGRFSTFLFRMPSHFEWQYACRGESGRKHFLQWPDSPNTKKVGEFGNYTEYLQKKDPELFEKHKTKLESFNGTDESMEKLLEDETLDKKLKTYLEELLRGLLTPDNELLPVADAPISSWNIKGMVGNVAEWVLLVKEPSADRGKMPSPGDFSNGNTNDSAVVAGSWNSASGKNVPWHNLSIWHWQKNTTYESKQQGIGGFSYGIRILMTDAVAETWFADLRHKAEQAYEGKESAQALMDDFESGVEVSGRDREGRALAEARIGIYGALAKARSDDPKSAGKLLKDSVVALGVSGDEFFRQLEDVIRDDDFTNYDK